MNPRILASALLLALLFVPCHGAENWHVFTSQGGTKLEARVINFGEDPIEGETVILERKSDRKTFEIALSRLSEDDVHFLKNHVPDDDDEDEVVERESWEDETEADDRFEPQKKQRGSDFYPQVINAKGTDIQPFPMGPVGGVMTVKMGDKTAEVTQLDSRGPGSQAGLEPGDRIVGANGRRFEPLSKDPATGGDGVPRDFGLALLEAQAGTEPLTLEVLRDSENLTIEVELPRLADFGEDFPAACARSDYLVTAAAEWLAHQHSDHGNFGSGNDYTTAMGALALLSTGDRRYRSILRDCARRFDRMIEGDVPNSNWIACAIGIYLAEYHLATGERAVLDSIERISREMGERVSPDNGRLGHNGKQLPYDGKGLVITTAHLHWLWGLAHRCGIPIDETTWKLSYRSVEVSISGDGSVGYNFSARGPTQSAARTGCMATALELAERERTDLRGMVSWMADNYKRCSNGHATTSMGLVLGFMGSTQGKDRDHRKCLDYYRWLFALCTPEDDDHGVFYYCKRDNFGGDGYLGYRPVGNYQMVLLLNSARNDTLWSFGNRTTEWLRP